MNEVKKCSEKIKETKTIISVIDHMDTDGVTVPEISWLLFLKVFDYHEKQRKSLIKGYKTILPEECQWEKWAGDKFKGYTGTDLLKFVDNILLDKLSKLTGSKDNRNIDIVSSAANVFGSSIGLFSLLESSAYFSSSCWINILLNPDRYPSYISFIIFSEKFMNRNLPCSRSSPCRMFLCEQ